MHGATSLLGPGSRREAAAASPPRRPSKSFCPVWAFFLPSHSLEVGSNSHVSASSAVSLAAPPAGLSRCAPPAMRAPTSVGVLALWSCHAVPGILRGEERASAWLRGIGNDVGASNDSLHRLSAGLPGSVPAPRLLLEGAGPINS